MGGFRVNVARTMRIALIAAAIFALLAPSVASAKEAAPWATVNVCDSAKRPDAIGALPSPQREQGHSA